MKWMNWMAFQDDQRKELVRKGDSFPWLSHATCTRNGTLVPVADPNYTKWQGYGDRKPK